MKVLIDNQVYENQSFGGISRYFNELQCDNGNIERMPLFQYKPPVKKSIYDKLRSKLNLTPVSTKKKFSNKYEFYTTQLNELNFDVFHPTYYDNYFLNSLKKPFVLTVHDMIHEKYPEYFGSSPDSINKRKLCAAADRIIAISETTKKDIIDIFGTSADKIEVIYHATNFDSIQSFKPPFNYEEKEYLLFTGNRNAYKNFLTFLIAVAPLLKQNKNLLLICTGPGFNDIEKKWINDLQLSHRVIHYYCNNDNELVYLYQNAECFVFPSLYEGFGLPLLEAFACKCPVVSSSGGSLEEIARDAAVYFDPKDIKSIRNSVYKVISDKGLQKELIEAGENRLNDFSWEKCRKETMDLYSRAI
ncbi:MAG: glycosyltransferase family 1 protein [Salegentibacter mishustinae]|nr:glycosyltransferase family 1 protein [Salegentibacter mishustinae]